MKTIEWEENLLQQIPNLRRYARALTQNTENADDLVQDCLERAWDKKANWSVGTNLRAWLFTIMHNVFISGTRRQKIQQEYLQRSEVAHINTVDDSFSTMRDLSKCLAMLKPEFREIILLVGLENLSYKEVAQVTSLPMGTVMSRLSRAREELRELMTSEKRPNLVSVK